MTSAPPARPVGTAPRRLAVRALLFLLGAAAPFAACGDGTPPAPGPALAAVPYDADGNPLRPLPSLRHPLNLVVILIDTLRADLVGLPGEGDAGGGAMPFVSSLAAQGIGFSNAAAPAPWTLPSVASILCGLLPTDHGCDVPERRDQLPRALTTFAEVLRNAYRYETAAFVAGPWLAQNHALLQGFATVKSGFALQGTEEMVGPWARERDRRRPFALLLHTFEAHDPYGKANHPWPEPPTPRLPLGGGAYQPLPEPWTLAREWLLDASSRTRFAQSYGPPAFDALVRYLHTGFGASPRADLAAELKAAYVDGVRWVDELVAETVRRLEGWGLLEDTLLVVTSDHGEAFGEHGMLEHGRDLHDEVLRVPLVMRGPEPFVGGRVVRGGVGVVDLFPTFFDLVGIEAVPGTEARSFLSLARDGGDGRVVLSEGDVTPGATRADLDVVLASARSPRWKYFLRYDRAAGAVTETAYDLEADPEERRDLASGAGILEVLPFDEAFCRGVREVRARVGRALEARARAQAAGHAGGEPPPPFRPSPCGP